MNVINSIKSKLFSNNSEKAVEPQSSGDVLLEALLYGETITREKAMTLPALSSDVDLICNLVASIPIKLYTRKEDNKVEEIKRDPRVRMLNVESGDTLDATQLKRAVVEDYLLGNGGYIYIEWVRNKVQSLRYVKDVSVQPLSNGNPIFKYNKFLVGGRTYYDYDFIKLLRRTTDGATSIGLINQVSKAIETAYTTLVYQLSNVKSGGVKKGFIQAENKIDQEAINKLKTAWANMFKNDSNSVVVLNKGLKFQESSNTSVEMQLNDSKQTLSNEIDKIFHISDDFNDTFKLAIMPILSAFKNALNKNLLLESEKLNHYFDFDLSEITKADVKERFEAYRTAQGIGLMTINEMRNKENMNSIEGLDVVNLGLGSVLYDTKTKEVYTPNTDKKTSLGDKPPVKEQDEKGGEKNEE